MKKITQRNASFFLKGNISRKLLLFTYILLLFLSGTTRDFGVTPLVAHSFGAVAAAFVEPLWKLVFWILPALFYIARLETRNIFAYLKLGNLRRGLLWGLLGSSLFLLRLLVSVSINRQLHFQLSFDDWLNGILLAGFIEEFVFRGFLFQELKTWWKDVPLLNADIFFVKEEENQENQEEGEEAVDPSPTWLPARNTFWACTVSTLLFVCIHFPSWILQHQPFAMILSTSLFNLFFGYALCIIYTRSQSLWSCIVMHSINNLCLSLS